MIFNKLSEDVIKDKYFLSLFDKLIENYFKCTLKNDFSEHNLTQKDMNNLSRFADILSNSELSNFRNISLKIMSNLYNFFKEEEYFQIYLKAILGRLGNFPAFKLLVADPDLPLDRKLELLYKMENQKVEDEEGKYFTDTQYTIIEKLKGNRFYSFSGPTSFGKTYIIKTKIKSLIKLNETNNVVVVVPTKALINEIISDFNDELEGINENKSIRIFSNYIIPKNRTKNNIFVLTPERLLAMLNENECPVIDCLFVDEAHKIGVENDQRSITLYLAIEKTLLKFDGINLYFSSPLIENPSVLLDLFNINSNNNSFSSSESPVDQNLMYIDLVENKKQIFHHIKNNFIDWEYDFNLNSMESAIWKVGNGNSNVIYGSSINETVGSAVSFKDFLILNKENFEYNMYPDILNLIDLIEDTLHGDFYLIECLKHGIAFHYGGLPQIIRLKIEELFKTSQINYLFCTSTLLEGINLPAKNLFILHNKKGLTNMSVIDFWNLAGRAGRLSYELSGNVICLRAKSNMWKSQKVLDKSKIVLNPVISSKIKNNTRKIVNVITEKSRRSNTTDYKITEYIGNVIAIDCIKNENSLILNKFNKDKLTEIENYFKHNEISVPYDILKTSYRIHLLQQNNAFIILMNEPDILFSNNSINYKKCLEILKYLHDIYEWEIYDKDLGNEKVLEYYAVLMNQWMNGVSIKKIIELSIENNVKKRKTIFKNHRDTGILFDGNNQGHVNDLINETLNDIEQIIQFKLQYYIENYIKIIEYISEDEVILDWAKYLEFGTNNIIEIALQNKGLSRQTAKFVVQNFSEFIEFSDEVIYIKKADLLKSVEGSIYESEIKRGLLLF